MQPNLAICIHVSQHHDGIGPLQPVVQIEAPLERWLYQRQIERGQARGDDHLQSVRRQPEKGGQSFAQLRVADFAGLGGERVLEVVQQHDGTALAEGLGQDLERRLYGCLWIFGQDRDA